MFKAITLFSLVYVESLGSLSKAKNVDLWNNKSADSSPSLHCDSLRMLINSLGDAVVKPRLYDRKACSYYFGNASSPCSAAGLL